MKTFEQFEQGISTVPISATWYLADLGEALGKQTLFVNQSPQKLKVLRDMREQGRVEAVSTGRNAFWRKLGNKPRISRPVETSVSSAAYLLSKDGFLYVATSTRQGLYSNYCLCEVSIRHY